MTRLPDPRSSACIRGSSFVFFAALAHLAVKMVWMIRTFGGGPPPHGRGSDQGDHLGSTWYTSLYTGSEFVLSGYAIRTAFGEMVRKQATVSRYGYAGAWGYQEHDLVNPLGAVTPDGRADSIFNSSPTLGFPYMHLGYRYYHPGSGRFLQRDPIGLRGGLNVYEYVRSRPSVFIDPLGLFSLEKSGARVGGVLIGAYIGGLPGAVIGGFLAGGYEEGDLIRVYEALDCALSRVNLESGTVMRVQDIPIWLNVHPEDESNCCLCGRPDTFCCGRFKGSR